MGQEMMKLIQKMVNAGKDGEKIDGMAIKWTTYRVHILDGSWLYLISEYDINDNKNRMA